MLGLIKLLYRKVINWCRFRKLAPLYKFAETKEDRVILQHLTSLKRQIHREIDKAYTEILTDKEMLHSLRQANNKTEVREALKPLIKRCKQIVVFPLLGDLSGTPPKKWGK